MQHNRLSVAAAAAICHPAHRHTQEGASLEEDAFCTGLLLLLDPVAFF